MHTRTGKRSSEAHPQTPESDYLRFCACGVEGCGCQWQGSISQAEFEGREKTARKCPGCGHTDVGFFTRGNRLS